MKKVPTTKGYYLVSKKTKQKKKHFIVVSNVMSFEQCGIAITIHWKCI